MFVAHCVLNRRNGGEKHREKWSRSVFSLELLGTDTPFISIASPRIWAHLYTAFLLFFSLLFLPLHRSLAQVLTRAIKEDGVTIDSRATYEIERTRALFFKLFSSETRRRFDEKFSFVQSAATANWTIPCDIYFIFLSIFTTNKQQCIKITKIKHQYSSKFAFIFWVKKINAMEKDLNEDKNCVKFNLRNISFWYLTFIY